jgi:hypothetical protein
MILSYSQLAGFRSTSLLTNGTDTHPWCYGEIGFYGNWDEEGTPFLAQQISALKKLRSNAIKSSDFSERSQAS